MASRQPVMHANDATHPVCLARSIASSIGKSYPVSGHSFTVLWEADNTKALVCEVCDTISIGWYRKN